MQNLFDESPDAESSAFQKEVDDIVKRNEGEVEINTFM